MTVLQDVITEAQGAGSVPALLRKLKVLAVRTGSSESLLRWVNLELNGYPKDIPLPDYRGPFDLMPFGHFAGPGGVQARNVQLSRLNFPEELREGALFVAELPQSISQIESWATSESTNFAWSAESVHLYNVLVQEKTITRTMQPGMVLTGVNRPAARHIFVGVLDQIRNRALDLALELEAVAPGAGEPDASETVKTEARQVITNYNFYGADFSGSNNAIGSSDFVQNLAADLTTD